MCQFCCYLFDRSVLNLQYNSLKNYIMKTIKRNLVIAVAFILGTFANFANIDSASISTKKVKVVFENVEKGHSLTIKDIEGIIYHQEKYYKVL